MVKKRACRIFVFFLALMALVNVSLSFEDGSGLVPVGGEARGESNIEKKIVKTYNYTDRIVNSNLWISHDGIPCPNSNERVDNSIHIYLPPCKKGTKYHIYGSFSFSDLQSSALPWSTWYRYGEQYRDYMTLEHYDNFRSFDYYTDDNSYLEISATSGTSGYTRGSWYSASMKITGSINIEYTPVSPTLNVIEPSQNDTVSEKNNCIPSISVSEEISSKLTCKYYIDDTLMDTKPAFNTANPQTVYFNAPDISKIAEGNRKIKFEVSNGLSDPITQTVDVIVDKSAPNITAFNIEPDVQSLNISVSASDNISGLKDKPYLYSINNSSGDKWTSENTCPKTGLVPNTKYKVAVEAADNGNNSAKQEKSVYTIPQTPQVSISNIKENAIDINLADSNPDPIQYEIKVGSNYVNSAGVLTSSSQLITPTGKKITVTGLSPNTRYNIQAKAKNGAKNDGAENCGAESGFSDITATTLAQAPANIAAEKTINSIKISWNAVNNATGYDIEADGRTIGTGTVTSYTHSDLQAETFHSFRVRTKNSTGAGPWSEYINVTTLPNPPDAPTIINAQTTYSAITINWNAVAGATGYEVEADGIKADDKEISIDPNNTISYKHKELQPDTMHKYRIRAKNAGGSSEWSAYTEVSTLPLPPETPANFKGVPTKNNITLIWSAADRAEGYELEVDGSSYDLKGITKYMHDGLAANSRHTYKIRAYNRGGRSAWSEQTITTWPEIPATPTNIMATSEKDSITVTWYSSPFAESYDIEVDGKNTVNVKELSYTQKDLAPGTKHSYRLRAKNITGDGNWSSPIEISTLPEEVINDGTHSTTPGAIGLTNIAAVVTNKTITIAWQAAKANIQYQVEVDGKIFDNGKDTVYNHTGLKPQSFHTYRVRTVDADGNGQWCAILALSALPDLPGAPANVNAAAADSQIELSWTKEDGVAYEVEADGEVISAGEAAGYINSGLKPGTSHTYRVRGRNITGVTAWSDSIIKSTTSPSYKVECKKDAAFNFLLLASNVDYFGGMSFVVTYNPEQLEVQDLCDLTVNNDTSSGKIPGTNLTVTHTPGKIVFSVDESIAPGANWSGEISTIIFKSKIDGKSGINYSIE